MSLTLVLDPPTRLILEPGFYQEFTTAQVAQKAEPADTYSAENLWADPAYGTVMLQPRQLDPNFLNHSAQLTSGAVQRLGTGLHANPTDISTKAIYEADVGDGNNPWIVHAPVAAVLPFPGITPLGITPSYSLNDVYNSSEGTGLLVPLVDTQARYAANVGFFFRWYVPRSDLTLFPAVYGLAVGQYFLVLRDDLVEVFQDVSAGGDRSAWQHLWSYLLFGDKYPRGNPYNANWTWGQKATAPTRDEEHSLLILPFRRSKVLLQSQNGGFIDINVRNVPKMLAGGADWDILRSDSLQVWALSAVVGRFQLQQVVYPTGFATLNLEKFKTEYTPAGTPNLDLKSDTFYDEQLVQTLQYPAMYTFPTNPTANDCPPPTTEGTGLFREYGVTLKFLASSDSLHSPQFYGLDIRVDPVFMDNPAAATNVFDTTGAPVVMSGEISVGTKPGDGHMRAIVQDPGPGYALKPYYYRTEMPVQLQIAPNVVFTGYTERLEAKPLRQTGAPVELSFRAQDRWLLLETTYLRDQKDWSGDGHITAVDAIVRQCGIDTTNPAAEYPAGWDGAQAGIYNNALDTPVIGTENLTGQQLLGWKPQPFDTGAMFLRRIAENFSGWLMGFRLDGTFYYLPYTYFTTPSLTFFAHAGRYVATGLAPNVGTSVGLNAQIDSGTYVLNGATLTFAGGTVLLPDNSTSTVYIDAAGTLSSNTTGLPASGVVTLGTVTTKSGAVTASDTSAASGRQTSTGPIYRNPVEFRTIEPTGNVVQVATHYLVDYTYNRSGLWVDWASIKNPAAPNYLGRYKWFVEEVQGAFSCPQLNALAYLTFQRARQRRKRVSFDADFAPTLKIGQVFNLEGYGQFRLLEFTGRLQKRNWEICTYVGEEIGPNYVGYGGSPDPLKEMAGSLAEGIQKLIDSNAMKKGWVATPPGRLLGTNIPISGGNKWSTQNFFTTGYNAMTGTTTIPFTTGFSPVDGSDHVTM